MKAPRWISLLSQKLRKPDGTVNWRVIGAATYATAVWTILGIVAYAYKSGDLKLTTDKKRNTVLDRKERSRMIAEDVAENKYTPENFIG